MSPILNKEHFPLRQHNSVEIVKILNVVLSGSPISNEVSRCCQNLNVSLASWSLLAFHLLLALESWIFTLRLINFLWLNSQSTWWLYVTSWFSTTWVSSYRVLKVWVSPCWMYWGEMESIHQPTFPSLYSHKKVKAECVQQVLTHGSIKGICSSDVFVVFPCCVLGHAMAHSAEQNHKVDASIHYNIPELQTSSWVSLPQQNGQKDPQHKGFIPSEHGTVSDSEEDDEEDEEEEYTRPKWQGIEAIFEAYQEHIEGKPCWFQRFISLL